MSWSSAIILVKAKKLFQVRLALFSHLEPHASRNRQKFFASFFQKNAIS
jgi:hypothetical protein